MPSRPSTFRPRFTRATRRTCARALGATLVVALAACAAAEPHADERPSFVLILADDHGWGETGRAGHPFVRTPALDALAAEGHVLARFYAAAPVCSPTRASLLTGRHPNRTRTFQWGHELPGDEVTLAELLRDAGWATGHFGKWHLGSVRAGAPTSPGAQGFETWASSPNFFDLDPLLSVGGEVVEAAGEGSDVVTDRALAFVRDACAAGRPFLAVVWYASPHDPHAATDTDRAAVDPAVPDEARAYVAEIEAIDRNVARLRAELDALGVADRTLVWYASDNGPRAPGAARPHATGGLRGEKGTLWEGGLRVPSIVAWPGTVPPGRASDAVAGTVDVLPTVLALAGVAPPERVALDGTSLAPLLRGEPFERAGGLGFWTLPVRGRPQHADRMLAAQRAGEVSPEETPPEPDVWTLAHRRGRAAWIAGDLKLHVIEEGEPEPGSVRLKLELYDLANDPGEAEDLLASRSEDALEMRRALEAWRTAVAEDALAAVRTAGTTVRVAACQVLVDGDREAAFARIDAALAEAAAQGAEIAVLPEACLLGWVNPEAWDRADPIPGATTDRLAALARAHGLTVVAGIAERDGERLFDSAVLIDPDGGVLLRHRKVNVLSELMDPPYSPGSPGTPVACADTRFGRVGLLVCADTFDDALVARLAAEEPDLVLVPYGWAAPEADWPDHGASLHAWIAHTARRTGAPVVGVDAVGALGHGPWKGFVLGGQSAWADASGALSEPLADRAPEVRVFDVPVGGARGPIPGDRAGSTGAKADDPR